jgi:hypothetical protein
MWIQYYMRSPKFPDWPEDEMKAYLKAKYAPEKGKHVRYFADLLGVSTGTAYNYLKQAGVSLVQKEEATIGERRTCSVCHRDLPLKKFHKDSTKSRGHSYVCKQCRKAGGK